MALINSFFVVDTESQFDGCRLFNCKSSVIRELPSDSPLEGFKTKVNGNESVVIISIVAGSIISPAIVFVQPLGFFDVLFRDVLLPPT
jgi:hypothetical protein